VRTHQDESNLVLLIAQVRERIGVLLDLPLNEENLDDLMDLFEQLARLEAMEREQWALTSAPTRH
jgi:hypothetical protein